MDFLIGGPTMYCALDSISTPLEGTPLEFLFLGGDEGTLSIGIIIVTALIVTICLMFKRKK